MNIDKFNNSIQNTNGMKSKELKKKWKIIAKKCLFVIENYWFENFQISMALFWENK